MRKWRRPATARHGDGTGWNAPSGECRGGGVHHHVDRLCGFGRVRLYGGGRRYACGAEKNAESVASLTQKRIASCRTKRILHPFVLGRSKQVSPRATDKTRGADIPVCRKVQADRNVCPTLVLSLAVLASDHFVAQTPTPSRTNLRGTAVSWRAWGENPKKRPRNVRKMMAAIRVITLTVNPRRGVLDQAWW